jgi:hypothetical protein
MTERERWIVYPLLFLALGAALRDKLFDRTTSEIIESIVCQELTVVDTEPVGGRANILARIGRTEPASGLPSSGYLVVNGQVEVQGVINARQYRYQGVPFVPALPVLPTGVTWPDLFRALEHAVRSQNRQQQNAPTAQPPQTTAPPQQPPEEPPAKPLADPTQNR